MAVGPEIFVVEELLDQALCQHLIQVAECCQFDVASVGIEQVDQTVRSNDLLYLDQPSSLAQSANDLLLGRVAVVQELLYGYYKIAFPHAEVCSILRYQKGQYYKRHIDNMLLSSRMEEARQGVPMRDISVVGYLNDDFEGGETYFDRQGLKLKPVAGSVVVFPAYFIYPHQSLPVTQGRKYVFTTWLMH
ncbi:MAG: 2OG-Fe(II) oxygenase [Leptolyngbyaceae cyanobacterium bins.59]|nr:2OG-Fe(II) oxygenase [Leptolyngbyaceae cyanobacterium bins.59]